MVHKEKITLITGNQGKAAEFERLLGFEIDHQKLELPEIQATDVTQVSSQKLKAAYGLLKKPVMVDDTGLVVKSWNGLPGALIKWFMDSVGNEGIINMMSSEQDRSASVITSIGYKDADREFVVAGELQGKIADAPKGDNGFGYDAIFIPDGQSKTFAEMTDQEKDTLSMRAIAANKLQDKLANND